ncbi:DNA-binding protein [Mesorhizobium sp. M0833]|uniref:DNA-binding protein n=1 Tax=Mesorhizobium sp. M0833 TaxID=2957009 RepID=UPI00333DC6A8
MQSAKAEKSQREKFEEAARELETDQSEEAFDRVLKKVVKSTPTRDGKEGGLKGKNSKHDRDGNTKNG